jgi:hypothetical protein
MKTMILELAIRQRRRVRFYYAGAFIEFEPYYVATDSSGGKSVYGKADGERIVKRFAFNRIYNLRPLADERFAPIIPLFATAG